MKQLHEERLLDNKVGLKVHEQSASYPGHPNAWPGNKGNEQCIVPRRILEHINSPLGGSLHSINFNICDQIMQGI